MGAQKIWAIIIGVVLVLISIWGFISSPILGIFQVNTLHNLVHLVTGAIFLWGGFTEYAKSVNKWLGVIYVLVAILGFIGLLGFLAVQSGNDLDNWLHLVVGIVSAGIGWFVE